MLAPMNLINSFRWGETSSKLNPRPFVFSNWLIAHDHPVASVLDLISIPASR